MLIRLDWELFANDPVGYYALREGFGFPALAFALYCGTVLLGLQAWLERPITGWGPRPSEELMAASGNPNLIRLAYLLGTTGRHHPRTVPTPA